MGETMIKDVYEVGWHKNDTSGFPDIIETPMETAQSKPQTLIDAVGTS